MPKGPNKISKSCANDSATQACKGCKHVGKLMSNKAPIVVRPCNVCKPEYHIVKDDRGKVTNTFYTGTRKQAV